MSTKATALSFNARTVTPTENSVIIPSGWQNATVTDGIAAATKGPKKGVCLTIEFTILDGEHKGRKVWNRFNIENANEKAQEIGQRDLSALCHATGVMDVSNDKCFNGKNLQIKIGVDKADDAAKEKGYEDKNNTKGYKPLEGAAAAPAFIPNGPPSNLPPAPGSAAPPAAPSVPAAAVSFPPEGWTVHPADSNYYFKGDEVLTVDDLKAKYAPAPVAAPVAPSVPAAPVVPSVPSVPAAPVPPVAAPFPPEGWTPHPASPGYFYQGQEVLTEADLRARVASNGATASTGSEVPPWER